jgi:SAM-dependent methyltransferase
MKLRESGMPEEEYWESLFDVDLILDRLGITNVHGDMVELGCGYGTFSLPLAKRVSGVLRTFDIEPEMIERTRSRAKVESIDNIHCELRDVFEQGFGVPSESQEACLLFNILHCEEPIRLLSEAACAIGPQGAVYVIHWRYDPTTPRGPRMEIRPRPEQIQVWALKAGLSTNSDEVIDLPPYHYGMVFRKSPPGEPPFPH